MMKNDLHSSASHPLKIDGFPLGTGMVGMMICPDWNRDFSADVATLRDWGTSILVSLTKTGEMKRARANGMAAVLGAAGIRWLQLPLPDTQAEGDDWHMAWRRVSSQLHQVLEAGGRVVIHCIAGLDQAATVAALLQCERGENLDHALRTIAEAREDAVPSPHQRRWLAALSGESDEQCRLMRASLFGGAIGDALGGDIEFLSLASIRMQYPDGVNLPGNGKLAEITDDTQMTLFTAEGLIRAVVRHQFKGISHTPSVVHHALMRWLETQSETGRIAEIDRKAGLITDPRLHSRRAPGNTCLSALRSSRHFGDMARNDSKGCGTIMRVAPVGLVRPRDVAGLADACSHLTHGHQTGRDAARAFATILMLMMEGRSPGRTAGKCPSNETGYANPESNPDRAAGETGRQGRNRGKPWRWMGGGRGAVDCPLCCAGG